MAFRPEELALDAPPVIFEDAGHSSGNTHTTPTKATWRPLYRHECAFGPPVFDSVMDNLIRNPNINSTWLFRADILHDAQDGAANPATPVDEADSLAFVADIPSFVGFELQRHVIRKLIPRNTLRDKPLDQTCLIYKSNPGGEAVERTLVIYLPHVSTPSDMPFYHPVVKGIAFVHEWTPAESCGSISLSYLFFDEQDRTVDKLIRTAFQLLMVIHKHGKGRVQGYQKRVHHDVLLPQARVQDTYTKLKQKHARSLIKGWAEQTDPEKHIFEDICIAAFMIELWRDMYGEGPFPGFVDVGCGNGLLVHILNQEGFSGWGFDARSRTSWASYSTRVRSLSGEEQDSLRELVLLPTYVSRGGSGDGFDEQKAHDGVFPKGTFIISNHADELTPWTPILAAVSDCPFISIPCCSHDLSGKLFRASPPKDKTKADSTYSSFVGWVSEIAAECGWEVEQEMLRIPSTRNAAIVGRKRTGDISSVDIPALVHKYGGTAGYFDAVVRLMKQPPSTHEHEANDTGPSVGKKSKGKKPKQKQHKAG
ncbi:tRNA(Ser) Um(44) 2'-O-methyltransferase [Podospora pseudopauciseta]|uniref:tRNA (uracil-O(2)-)-methyltransferase n=1 Tax=Podospora pseudopauciseta TaxID=2093780 RepID=A0ABR0I2K1_9PEZI|nr:tRNA(Ser) Um(44) 2'-O-methyltransferase [Podospora pseudopauciseta]